MTDPLATPTSRIDQPWWAAAAVLAVGLPWLLLRELVIGHAAQLDPGLPAVLRGFEGLLALGAVVALVAWLSRRAARRVQQAGERARTALVLLEASNLGLGLLGTHSRLREGNHRLAELLGCPPDGLAGTDWLALLHPDDLPAVQAALQAVQAGEAPRLQREARLQRPDGQTVDALLTLALPAERPTGTGQLVIALQDVSALKQAQREAMDSRRRLQTVLDVLPVVVTLRDDRGRYEYVNAACAALLGRPAHEIVGQEFDSLYGSEDGEVLRAIDRDVLGGGLDGVQVEREFQIGRLLRRLQSRVLPLLDAHGRRIGVLSVSRDVTVERTQQAALERALDEQRRLRAEAEQQRQALQTALQDAQDARARLDSLVAALPDMLLVLDAQARVVDLRVPRPVHLPAMPAEVVGRRLPELVESGLALRALRRLRAALRGRGLQRFEYDLVVGASRLRYEMRMVRAGADRVIALARDITAEDQARRALARSEQRLKFALEGSGDAGWDWDLQADRLDYSSGFAALLRHPGPGFREGFLLRERLHPDDRSAVLAHLREAVGGGQPFAMSFRLRCYDGEYRWFLGRGGTQRDAEGRSLHFSGVLSDLSARLQAEERLRLAQAVFEHMREGVLITDAQGRIVSVNPALARIMGRPAGALVGHTPQALGAAVRDVADLDALWAEASRQGHWQGEVAHRTHDGRLVPLLMSVSALRDVQGALTHHIAVCTDITAMKQAEARLDFLAHHDALTQLPNRLMFGLRLDQALAAAERHGARLALVLLDLDHFKHVNDSWGHAAGDRLLQHVADLLRARVRRSDTLARLGGDEFALLMTDLHDADDAARLAAELLTALALPWHGGEGEPVAVGASVGIALYPAHGTDAATLMAHADAALYRAKGDGRSVVRFYSDELTTAVREKLRLEARLRRALAERRLALHWQPQFAVATGALVGAEALLRWHEADEGWVAPARFIPVAEACGLIGDLGRWVLGEALRQAGAWRADGLDLPTIAVNVSARQLHHGDLAAETLAALATSGIAPSQLELEMTESVLMAGDGTAAVLERLDAAGVRLAVDDFGTGYSSLAQLKRFPVHRLKIDRSFIRDLPHDLEDAEIATSIGALGHALGLELVAEGVETVEQLDFLRERGCDAYQGFLTARPMPADEFARFCRHHAEAQGAALLQ